MKAMQILAGVAAGFVLAGCGSSTPQTLQNPKPRPAVMDLDDTPPKSIPAPPPAAPAPPAAAEAPAAPAPRKHVVAAKETLYAIAKQYYGNGNQWPKIVEANPGLVPEKMPVGKAIIIP